MIHVKKLNACKICLPWSECFLEFFSFYLLSNLYSCLHMIRLFTLLSYHRNENISNPRPRFSHQQIALHSAERPVSQGSGHQQRALNPGRNSQETRKPG